MRAVCCMYTIAIPKEQHLLTFQPHVLFFNRKHTYVPYRSNNDGTDMNNFRMAIAYIQHVRIPTKTGVKV